MVKISDNQSDGLKRKIMLVATIILFLVLAYLVYTTFFSGSSSTSSSKPVVGKPIAAQSATTLGQPTAPGSVQPVSQASISMANVKNEGVPTPSAEEQIVLQRGKEVEKKYLELVSQYQLAQLQQKLEQTNAQIAQSRLSALKAESEAKKFDLEVTDHGKTGPSVIQNIRAMYVGYSEGSWMAMLNLDGAMYQVRVGMHLPDGSIVSSIRNSGVVLQKNGQRMYLAIPTSLDKANSDSPANANANVNAAPNLNDSNSDQE